jgi:hypothetical protein
MNTENTTDREKFLIAEALFTTIKFNKDLAESNGTFETSNTNDMEYILKTKYKTYYDLFEKMPYYQNILNQ